MRKSSKPSVRSFVASLIGSAFFNTRTRAGCKLFLMNTCTCFANRFLRESGRDVVALRPLLGHSRIDTTQLYTDEIEVDELAAALARGADGP